MHIKSSIKKLGTFIKSNKTVRYILYSMVLLAVFSVSVVLFGREEKPQEPDNSGGVIIPENPDNSSGNSSDEVDFSKLTYAALGDSITYGNTYTGGRLAKPYPQLVKETLGLKAVYNYGIGGTRLSGSFADSMCNRYVNMVNDVDIVSVMGGTNDALSLGNTDVVLAVLGTPADTDNSTVYGALDILCRGLKEKYPNSFIFFMTPLDLATQHYNYGANRVGFTLDDVCSAIKVVCARYNILVFDVNEVVPYQDLANTENATSAGDGIHPGQDFITNSLTPKIVEFIKENYKK